MNSHPKVEDGQDQVRGAIVQGLVKKEFTHFKGLGIGMAKHFQHGPAMVCSTLSLVGL